MIERSERRLQEHERMAKKKKPTIASRLAAALRDKNLVRFSRPFEDGTVSGFVLDVGPRFFMIAFVTDDIWLNGFQCFRIGDVRALEVPHPNATFVEAALERRKVRLGAKPKVNVGDIAALIRSAGRQFPLIVVHREMARPDVCWIGRVVEVTDKHVSLLEIGPDAEWERSPSQHALREITQVSFGADYEDALHLVASK